MTTVATKAKTEVSAPAPTHSERFTDRVLTEFKASAGTLQVSSFQKKLIQNYFIKMDMVLKAAESKRLSKRDPDPLEFKWENVNMQQLALDVVSFSCIGLDPLQPNHINLVPYKNEKTNKFDIGFLMGYDGLEIKAKKYGLDIPDDVIVELVYSTDVFKSYKKSRDNKVESYDFEVTNDFNRGEIVGGFYYHIFNDRPEKNKLEVFTKADIDKRKPKYASAEFWGGEKDKWVNGKKDGKETIEGWYEEMAWKTIKRAAYNDIVIDSQKIDDHLVRAIQRDQATSSVDIRVAAEIQQNANRSPVSFEDAEVVEEPKVAMKPSETFNDSAKEEVEPQAQTAMGGPGF